MLHVKHSVFAADAVEGKAVNVVSSRLYFLMNNLAYAVEILLHFQISKSQFLYFLNFKKQGTSLVIPDGTFVEVAIPVDFNTQPYSSAIKINYVTPYYFLGAKWDFI